MSIVAYPLVALALTGSPTKAGLVGTFALLGQMVFRLPAGALVDRHDRRRVMLVADSLRGLVILGVVVALVAGALSLTLLIAAAFTENAMGEFFRPASTAAVRRVIDPVQMPEAVSKSEARSYGVTIAGPPLGGLLYGVAQYLPFAADAASYVYSFISTLLVRTPMRPKASATTEPERIITQLTGGVRWIWGHLLIRCMILSAAGFNVVCAALYLTVVVAARTAGATSVQIGIMLGMASAGGFAGSFLAVRLASYRHPSRLVLAIMWSAGAVIPLMAINQNPYLLGALLAVPMILAPTANTIILSLQVVLTPDHMQGRVSAGGEFISNVAAPIAPLAGGFFVTTLSAPTALILIGALMVIVAGLATASRTMRTIPRLSVLVAGDGLGEKQR
jgi:MFS family permease